jgi:hypothetical protein
MKNILILFTWFLYISLPSSAQTVYYYGVNNKPLTDGENALIMIRVDQSKANSIKMEAFMKWRNDWRNLYIERIKIKSENEYLVKKFSDRSQTDKYIRFYSPGPEGTYAFVEMYNDAVKRKGITTTRLPLNLEGEVIEYYNNENIKSKSVYKDNQLVSNENWLENGEKYIDNIFYSADVQPSYDIETDNLLAHVSNKFSQHKLIDVSGTILVGFVIMEDGSIAGTRIVSGIQPALDKIAVDALQSFPGKWKPAVLNNQNVRFFCTMPINFKTADEFVSFDQIDFTGGMLFYQ